MSISITPIDPARHLDFAGLVDGIDLRRTTQEGDGPTVEQTLQRA
jgi:hypothetical protein